MCELRRALYNLFELQRERTYENESRKRGACWNFKGHHQMLTPFNFLPHIFLIFIFFHFEQSKWLWMHQAKLYTNLLNIVHKGKMS